MRASSDDETTTAPEVGILLEEEHVARNNGKRTDVRMFIYEGSCWLTMAGTASGSRRDTEEYK
jgi:hypothetical protein